MKRIISLLIMVASTSTPLYCWKSAEVKGEQPTFFGHLTTQEDNSFYITNISIGKAADEQEKVMLYEKPRNMMPSQQGYILPGNPYKELSTATLELQKIKKIEVPEPHITWKWINNESLRSTKMAIEFLEVIVTWRAGNSTPYLLELGAENSRRQVKLFCDVIDTDFAGLRQGNTMLCPGVKKADVHKKGAPFQSIKMVEIEDPCYKIPDNAGTMKNNEND